MEKATPVNRVSDDEVWSNSCNLLHMADRSRSRCGIALITGHRYLNTTDIYIYFYNNQKQCFIFWCKSALNFSRVSRDLVECTR